MAGRDGTVITQSHPQEQALGQGLCRGHAPGKQRCCGRIQHDEIGLLARREVADLRFKTQRLRTRQRRQVEGLQGRHQIAVQVGHLIGGTQGTQQAEAGAATHVTADAHAYAAVDHLTQVEQAAPQEEIGTGAKR